jgi:hypothetical protein
MTTYGDVYPQVPLLSPRDPEPVGHRASTVTGGHPLMGNPGAHVLPRNYGMVLRYLAAVMLPLIGVLLVLGALRVFGNPMTATVPVPSVSVAPSSCTFPDGS